MIPLLTSANGGDQRVQDSYLINLTRSPFTPIVGVKTAMTVSFVDLATGAPIQDDIRVHIWITDGRGSKNIIHEEKDIPVDGGILDFSYTFAKTGIHEIYFEFTRVNDPETIHQIPDFMIDVQPAESRDILHPFSFGFGLLIGLLSGILVSNVFKRWNS